MSKQSAEMSRFNTALRKVLSVSHSDMQRMIAEDKQERKAKPSVSAPASGKKA